MTIAKTITIPVITIDGPSGTGKGTIGQLLALELGWHYLDSGSLYRVLALAAEHHQVALDDETGLAHLASNMDIQFKINGHDLLPRVILDHLDVTEAIRSENCGNNASKVGVLPKVRQALLELQRAFRTVPGLVTDGRDMGSVVFPDAPIKLFLDASPQERAERRYNQLKKKGINVSLDALCTELVERDRRDRERVVAPLKPAPDAIIIDTTHMGIEEELQKIREIVRSVFPEST